jgi:DNA-binding helix-hairpin-helix protein with protein kinase domain
MATKRADLGSLEELGRGGEGVVYRCLARPGQVYKEFQSQVLAEVDESALNRLIALPASLDAASRQFLLTRTAWPVEKVVERGAVVGYTMPLIPGAFFVKHGVKAYPNRCECDWNKLAMRTTWLGNSNIVSDVPQVSGTHLLEVLIDLCKIVDLLHKMKLIIGDISGRNMLWSLTPAPAVMMIDNDGYRVEGARGVTLPKQTPDWQDPYLGGADTTQQSDLYKLSLALLRGYMGSGIIKPEQVHSNDPAVTRLLDSARRGTSASNRPRASEWLTLLTNLRQQLVLADRPVLQMPPIVTRPPKNLIESFVPKRPILKLN